MANPSNKKSAAPNIPGLRIPAPEPTQVPDQSELRQKVTDLQEALKSIEVDLKEVKDQIQECGTIRSKLTELKGTLYSMMVRQLDSGQDTSPSEYEALLLSEISSLTSKIKSGPSG